MNYYLAVDIGASSGRHILCHVEDSVIITEEIHRFENGAKLNQNGTLCWDSKRLFNEILAGMKKCSEIGKIPKSIGIDTWGVDFVLIDSNGEMIGDSVCYRDKRTKTALDYVSSRISDIDLYTSTGIQKQEFNTIYQLASIKQNNPEQLENAEHMLMLPDYFNYLLTGEIKQEYTNATTTGLVNAKTRRWDMDLIKILDFPAKIFTEINEPCTVVGALKNEIASEVGYNLSVIMAASHDTASAVMAVPSQRDDIIYISSGTWSLMGIESVNPDCSEESLKYNFTNEGGYGNKYRYLKNIMGLWMIQQVRHELDDKYSFPELCDFAENSTLDTIIDCSDNMFLSPESMINAIKDYCTKNGLDVPESIGDIARVIYRSLAHCYAKTAEEIENATGERYSVIHVIGGGSNAAYLNKLTAEFTKKTVYAGPSEATAFGNLAAQLIVFGEFRNLSEIRWAIRKSCVFNMYS